MNKSIENLKLKAIENLNLIVEAVRSGFYKDNEEKLYTDLVNARDEIVFVEIKRG